VNIDAGKAVILLHAAIKLHLRLYRETLYHFENKERLRRMVKRDELPD